MRTIVVALDGTPGSLRAAETAKRLFDGPDTEFVVVQIDEVLPWVAAGPFGSWNMWPPAIARPDAETRAAASASAARAGLADAAVDTRHGEVVTEICRAADEHDAAVIVVGSRDKGLLGRLLEPSVADGVVHRAHRPVLVVSGDPRGGDA